MRIFPSLLVCLSVGIYAPAFAATCNFELPDIPVMGEHPANYGRLRTAYDLWSKQEAVEAENCGCPYSKPFSAFTEALSTKGPEDLSQADVSAIRTWSLREGSGILERQMAFMADACQEE